MPFWNIFRRKKQVPEVVVSQEPTEETEPRESRTKSELEKSDLIGMATAEHMGGIKQNQLQILNRLETISSDMAKEGTLQKVYSEMAKEDSLRDLQMAVMGLLANKLRAVSVSGIATDTETRMPKVATQIAQKLNQQVNSVIWKESQKKILAVLKEHGELPFGNDKATKGLTKYTGLNRSWLYKACYLGWDSSGRPDSPQKDTLLAKGLIEIGTGKKPIVVRLKNGI